MTTALPRSQVEMAKTWNAESVFASPEAFDAEVQSILESLPSIRAFQGHLGDSPDKFIGIGEIGIVSTPEYFLWFFEDLHAF